MPPKNHSVRVSTETLTKEEKAEAINDLSIVAKKFNLEFKTTIDQTPQIEPTWIPEDEWKKKGMCTNVIHLKQGK